jgi:thiosulfate/3-mercaptopyruvate sulfurtransferase
MHKVSRRSLLAMAAVVPLLGEATDPWAESDLIQPSALAAQIGKTKLTILQVGFPALFHGAHIPGAIYAGSGSKPEGIALMMKVLEGVPASSNVVLYCGCCPWEKCPNVRPAFRAVKEKGYANAKLLVIPTNLHTDWITKGYPIERA